MRTILLNDGREMGTNDRDGGVFCRRKDGTWGQWTGTCQTPVFRDGLHFKRWLTKRYADSNEGFQGTRIIERSF